MYILSVSPSDATPVERATEFVEVWPYLQLTLVEKSALFARLKHAINQFAIFDIISKSLPDLDIELFSIPDDIFKNIEFTDSAPVEQAELGNYYFDKNSGKWVSLSEHSDFIISFPGYNLAYCDWIKDKTFRDEVSIFKSTWPGNEFAMAFFNEWVVIYGERYPTEDEVDRYLDEKVSEVIAKIIED